jgi:hypothetical protein
MKKSILSTSIVSSFLLLYHFIFQLNGFSDVIICMFIAAPFLMGWMVLSILTDNSIAVKELDKDEEWGYQDKRKQLVAD